MIGGKVEDTKIILKNRKSILKVKHMWPQNNQTNYKSAKPNNLKVFGRK